MASAVRGSNCLHHQQITLVRKQWIPYYGHPKQTTAPGPLCRPPSPSRVHLHSIRRSRTRNNPQGLSNGSWKLVCCWVKIYYCEWKFSVPSFERFATTKGAMAKRRLQAYSAPWIGLETSLVAFLILGWWCFIDGWKYRPEFFILRTWEWFCLYHNN
jgi:hypothetical protein